MGMSGVQVLGTGADTSSKAAKLPTDVASSIPTSAVGRLLTAILSLAGTAVTAAKFAKILYSKLRPTRRPRVASTVNRSV